MKSRADRDLQYFLAGLEADPSLFEPGRLRDDLDSYDDLDTVFGDFDSEAFKKETNGRIHHQAKAIRNRLEADNADLYQAIRSEIMHGAQPHALLQWSQASAKPGRKRRPSSRLGL